MLVSTKTGEYVKAKLLKMLLYVMNSKFCFIKLACGCQENKSDTMKNIPELSKNKQ